jgi:6-phosphofructokinase 1
MPQSAPSTIQDAYQRGKSHAIVVVAEGARYDADALARHFTEHAERLRFELRITKLGHVQRGGAPCPFDRLSASLLGAAAVERLEARQHGVLLGIVDGELTATALADLVHARKPLDPKWLKLARVLAR